MAVLLGQTTEEVDIASRWVAVMRATIEDDTSDPLAKGNEALRALPAGLDGTADAAKWSKARRSDEVCVLCEDRETQGGVLWHEAPYEFFVGWGFGHGTHDWLLQGSCGLAHPGICLIWASSGEQTLTAKELARAVAAQDVATLAGYANAPSVSIFAERSAIQIRGCDGETIVGHVPVNPELLAAIEAAVAQLASAG